DDLPQQVVVARAVGAADVHGRALAHRLEALEHLNRLGVVFLLGLAHLVDSLGSGNATRSSSRRTDFTLSFFDISRPFPPRDVTSYLPGDRVSLRPFWVSSSRCASFLFVHKNATT